MASFLFNKYREAMLSQSPVVDLDTDTVKACLVTSAYTPNAADQFLSSGAGTVGGSRPTTTDQTLASKTVTDGVFDAADVSFPAVTGAQCVAVVLYKDTGSAATSPLIAYIDSAASGLPVTPNGGAINITWDNGTNRIFKIG